MKNSVLTWTLGIAFIGQHYLNDDPFWSERPAVRIWLGFVLLVGGVRVVWWCLDLWFYNRARWWSYILGIVSMVGACAGASLLLLGSILPPRGGVQ